MSHLWRLWVFDTWGWGSLSYTGWCVLCHCRRIHISYGRLPQRGSLLWRGNGSQSRKEKWKFRVSSRSCKQRTDKWLLRLRRVFLYHLYGITSFLNAFSQANIGKKKFACQYHWKAIWLRLPRIRRFSIFIPALWWKLILENAEGNALACAFILMDNKVEFCGIYVEQWN